MIAYIYGRMDPTGPSFPRHGFATLQCDVSEVSIDGVCQRPVVENENECRGNPIDSLSGFKKENSVDFAFDTSDDFKFERFYSQNGIIRSMSSSDRRLGNGWRSNFESSWAFFSQNRLYFTLPEGKELVFIIASGTWQAGSIWAPAYLNAAGTQFVDGRKGVRESLIKTSSNLELTTAEGVIYVYSDTNGRLLSIRRRGGYIQTLNYDINGLLTSV